MRQELLSKPFLLASDFELDGGTKYPIYGGKQRPSSQEYLTSRIIELASRYGRYGYRRVTALLKNEGWIINHKCAERVWWRKELGVHEK